MTHSSFEYPDTGKAAQFFSATDVFSYLLQYSETVKTAIAAVSPKQLEAAVETIEKANRAGNTVYVAGNGGSAAIAEHLCCDWMKGTHLPGQPPIRVSTLGSNFSFLTAVSNDYGYEFSFSAQLDMLARRNDVGVFVSSSGNSRNVLKAVEVAKSHQMTVIGMTGFEGGKLKEVADISLHVPFRNYGVVEDCHQSLMHVIAQFLYLRRR